MRFARAHCDSVIPDVPWSPGEPRNTARRRIVPFTIATGTSKRKSVAGTRKRASAMPARARDATPRRNEPSNTPYVRAAKFRILRPQSATIAVWRSVHATHSRRLESSKVGAIALGTNWTRSPFPFTASVTARSSLRVPRQRRTRSRRSRFSRRIAHAPPQRKLYRSLKKMFRPAAFHAERTADHVPPPTGTYPVARRRSDSREGERLDEGPEKSGIGADVGIEEDQDLIFCVPSRKAAEEGKGFPAE